MRKFIAFAAVGALAATTAPITAQEPVWDANTVGLESQKLADGVFAVVAEGARDMAAKG